MNFANIKQREYKKLELNEIESNVLIQSKSFSPSTLLLLSSVATNRTNACYSIDNLTKQQPNQTYTNKANPHGLWILRHN